MAKSKWRKTAGKLIKKRRVRILLYFTGFCFFTGAAVTCFLIFLYLHISEDLPKINSLRDYRPPVVTSVYADNGEKIAEFYEQRRIVVPLSRMSPTLINAFIAVEDSRFFDHEGVDLMSIVRAFFKNMEAGTIVQGGSTITQQVTKSFLLTPEKTYRRKLREALLAYRIEKAFTKEEILFLYLNQIYLGHGAYGVEAAAQNYFGRSARALNLAQCAMLAGLPQAPSRYSPYHYPKRARRRQHYVLERMVEEGYITPNEAETAYQRELAIQPRRNWYLEKVPFFTEHIRQYIEGRYGRNALYRQGLKIYTTVNVTAQEMARKELDRGLRKLDKRQNSYRGPLAHLSAEAIPAELKKLQAAIAADPLAPGQIRQGVVVQVLRKANQVQVRLGDARGYIPFSDMVWTRKYPGTLLEPGDRIAVKLEKFYPKKEKWKLSLEQTPEVQGALLCLETGTGRVKAMVGGRDFSESQFNRATQSRRQPGSAFKPIVYAAAIDKGYTPVTVVHDIPFVYRGGSGELWRPHNYDHKFYGPMFLRKALTKSRNLPTVRIAEDIGVKYLIEYARKLGITSHLAPYLPLALGSSGVSLLELVRAYSVFANDGYLIQPVFITRILDRDGQEIQPMPVEKTRAVEPATAYIMTSMLESVVQKGTGYRVRALNRPVAGKTGTTNEYRDAWFVGYTPRYITGTWVGFDDQTRSLGRAETGSRAASPIWLGFMEELLADLPVEDFKPPEDVVFRYVDAGSGLLASAKGPHTIQECFKKDNLPPRYPNPLQAAGYEGQSSKKPKVITREQFFKMGM